jgi:predicted Rossmann-fold nucleotide-binding protein
VMLNVKGFWDLFLRWVEHAVEVGFMREEHRGLILEAKTAEEAVEMLRGYKGAEKALEEKEEMA